MTGGTAYPAYGPQRAAGFLGDLGAPDIYYLNLNGTAANVTADQMLAQLDTARTGNGLVLDGRGYPSTDVTELLAHVIGGPALSPQFRFPSYEGPDTFSMVQSQYTQQGPTGAPFTLPVTILVGPETQSYAEDLIMILEARHDLTIVGRQTAGSNGNITTTLLPGGLGMAFTGMQVRFSDGNPFHGIGIVADHPSAPSRADAKAGIDRELVDGIAAVRGM